MAEKITEARKRILRSARGNLGIIYPAGVTSFVRTNWKRNADWLVANGYIEPSPHEDFYITEKGRSAVAP